MIAPAPRAHAPRYAPVQVARALLTASVAVALGFASAQPEAAALQSASPQQVRSLLAAVDSNPSLQAARALAESARENAAAVRAPLDLNLQLSQRNLALELPPIPPAQAATLGEQTTRELTARVVLRPFLYGDLADLYDQRLIEIERAALQAREAQATLEVGALNAALGLWLSELAANLAAEAVQLAEAAETATLRRAGVGGASTLEVGRAELAAAQARANLRDAARQVALARARLDLFAPGNALAGPFDIDPVFGPTPEQLRSALDQQLIELAKRNANRATQPTLQASYTWLGDDGSATLGIESRTLQPTFSLALNETDPKAPPPAIPQPKATGSFTLALSWSLSLQARGEASAAMRQADAAAANTQAANERAVLTQQALLTQLEGTQEALALSQQELALATLERDINDQRLASGSISELAHLQARVAYHQVLVNHARARVNVVAALLEGYSSYAIPPSQVLP